MFGCFDIFLDFWRLGNFCIRFRLIFLCLQLSAPFAKTSNINNMLVRSVLDVLGFFEICGSSVIFGFVLAVLYFFGL